MINNDMYAFSPEARETLLLNYELWFKFICNLEKMMIRSLHDQDKLGDMVLAIRQMGNDIIVELNDVIQTHPTIFNGDSPATMMIKKCHAPFIDEVLRVVADCRDRDMYVSFPLIITSISNNLHNLLFILHEVENMKRGNLADAFLSYTSEVLAVWKKTGECPLLARALLYKNEYGVTEFDIKNYTCMPINEAWFANCDAIGITIEEVNQTNDFSHHSCEFLIPIKDD